jgi:hypothetical protein
LIGLSANLADLRARAACGGNLSLPQWPLKVIQTLRTAPSTHAPRLS